MAGAATLAPLDTRGFGSVGRCSAEVHDGPTSGTHQKGTEIVHIAGEHHIAVSGQQGHVGIHHVMAAGSPAQFTDHP